MPASLPTPSVPPGHLFCFGLGYTAERLAGRLRTAGWTVTGTVRTAERRSALQRQGIDVCLFEPDLPLESPGRIFSNVTHLLVSIPPGDAGDPALLAHGADLRAAAALAWAGYLSTPAVYGDRAGGRAGEDDRPTPGSARGHRRLAAELAWAALFRQKPTALQIFRLAGIYGPGRNAIDQVVAGTARIIEKPGQIFNRIHVDDIGSILIASMTRPDPGRIYNVADNEACASGEVIRFACALLGVEPPQAVPFEAAALSPMARSFYSECKKLDTRRIRQELGVCLRYPTYREGLTTLLAHRTG